MIENPTPRAPDRNATFADGSEEKLWSNYEEQQIELQLTTETTSSIIKQNM
ncbi:hypothetical protein ACJBX0_10010 [Streptococcus suis]